VLACRALLLLLLLLLLIQSCQRSLQHLGLSACWLGSAANKAASCQCCCQRDLSANAAPH
jgi:hypothetical protein